MAEPAPAKLRLAESIDDKQPGELIVLDQRGELVSRRASRARMATLGVVFAGFVTVSAIAFGPVSLIGPLAVGGAAAGFVYLRYRSLRRALALIAAWRNDEARAALIGIRSPTGIVRVEVERLLAVLEWRRGDFNAAVVHIDRAIGFNDRKNPTRTVQYWLCAAIRVEILIELDLDRARALVPELDGMPRTAVFDRERHYIALQIAFHADAPDTLPADDTLYDWAKLALADNNGGFRVGLLAWAFDRRGDRDMADHLLREVRSHLQMPFAAMAPIAPPLHAWLTSQAERSASGED